jgi:phosphohistidine phosphatase
LDVYLLRHGEAGARSPNPSKDFERSLTVSGKQEIQEISRAIGKIEKNISRIVTSPLARTAETASIAAKELKLSNRIEKWDELKPEGKTEAFYAKIMKLKRDSSILVVGHEPYLSTMISELISGSKDSRVSLKKGGLAKVRIDRFSPKPSGELRWLLTPGQMKKMI